MVKGEKKKKSLEVQKITASESYYVTSCQTLRTTELDHRTRSMTFEERKALLTLNLDPENKHKSNIKKKKNS